MMLLLFTVWDVRVVDMAPPIPRFVCANVRLSCCKEVFTDYSAKAEGLPANGALGKANGGVKISGQAHTDIWRMNPKMPSARSSSFAKCSKPCGITGLWHAVIA